MPKEHGADPSRRSKKVVVITRPYCSPDPSGPKYEQYCKQKLMQHRPFRRQEDLLEGCDTYAAAYAIFLQSKNVPPSLEEDILRLQEQATMQDHDDTEVHVYALYTLLACLSYSASCLFRESSVASHLSGQMRSGCLYAGTMLTSSQTLTPSRTLTGLTPLKPTPTWRKCHLSSLASKSQQLQVSSPPLPTPSICKASSFRSTPYCRSI